MKPQILNEFSAIFQTSLRYMRSGSDFTRWSDKSNLLSDWNSRTTLIASLIPNESTVLEFGAGRMFLADELPQDCSYTPSDLVDRGNGTIVFDLNADVPFNFPRHDVAVFSGVLEYVNNLPLLISHLSKCVRIVVASYACHDNRRHRCRFLRKLRRRRHGFVNDYSDVELQDIFEKHGFTCDQQERWPSQRIYRFVRNSVV